MEAIGWYTAMSFIRIEKLARTETLVWSCSSWSLIVSQTLLICSKFLKVIERVTVSFSNDGLWERCSLPASPSPFCLFVKLFFRRAAQGVARFMKALHQSGSSLGRVGGQVLREKISETAMEKVLNGTSLPGGENLAHVNELFLFVVVQAKRQEDITEKNPVLRQTRSKVSALSCLKQLRNEPRLVSAVRAQAAAENAAVYDRERCSVVP